MGTMSATLLPNGKQQFIDINGKPLVGGTVGMYVPATLIFKSTWQDNGESILNTNPVVLDSRGQALIYGSGTYRQILKDALGNTIWDELTGGLGTGGSQLFFLSSYSTLAQADAAAAAVSGTVVIDVNTTLTASIALAAPTYLFANGIITLGNFNLTFSKQNFIASGSSQLFATTGSGVVLGTIQGSISVDWWGTTSTTIANVATTNACNACLVYVMQSLLPSTTVLFTKDNYFLSGPIVKSDSVFCPTILGNGQSVLTYSFAGSPGNAGFVIIGTSGYPCSARISGFIFECGSTSWGFEIRGQNGLLLEHFVVTTGAFGIVLNNQGSGKFTEAVTWRNCFISCAQAWWHRLSGGTPSFHGSGPVGDVVVNTPVPTGPYILLDDDTECYGTPQTFRIFVSDVSFPVFGLGNNTYLVGYGDIDIENTSGGGAVILATHGTGGKPCTFTGGITAWAGPVLPGAMVLMENTLITSTGTNIQGRCKGFVVSTTLPITGGPVALAVANSKCFQLMIFISFTNYSYTYTATIGTDPFGNGNLVNSALIHAINTAGYGAPTLSWDGTNLSITNASYPAGVTANVTCTDLGTFGDTV